MADAEVKLNFTAQVEQARAAIAEIAAAMEKIQGSGGFMRPEDAALLNEMQGQLVAYKARLDELSAAYRALQSGGGQANEQALAQIKELQEEVARLTKTQDDLLKKVVDLQVANNELKGAAAGVSAETEKAGRDGVRVVRSMRGAVANFIRDLARGKLAVRELGLALKGLAYSTVVLGAIQLAMEGIGLVWEKIKGVFSASEEEMEAAREAAEKAKEQLEDAKREAERAAGEVQRLKEKLAEKEAAETLKETLAAITAEYVAQRDAVDATLAAVKEQAQVKARERAAEKAAKTGELDMELLDLEERFVNGDIGKRDYIVQKAEIEKRKREEARVAEVDAAEIERDAAAARTKAAKAELKNAQDRVTDAEEEAGKYATDDDVKLAEAKYDAQHKKVVALRAKADKLESDFLNKYFNEDMTFKHDVSIYSEEYEADRLALERAKKIADEEGEKQPAMQREIKALKDSAAKGKEASTRLNEERKTAEKLEKDADAAVKAEEKANAALAETLAKTAREGGQDDRMTGKRVDIELAKIAKDERGKAGKAADTDSRKRGQLQAKLDKLMGDVQMAADTQDDLKDDARAVDAVDKFVTANAEAMRKYGVDVSRLISLTDKLRLIQADDQKQMNSIRSRLDALERDVQRNANFNRKS